MIDNDVFKLFLTHFELKAETKKEGEHPEDAKLRRLKDKWLFFATLIMISAIMIFCGYFALISNNATHIGIALNGIIGFGLAFAGYYVRGRQ